MVDGKKIITAEAVGKGHPDKICDQIADYILDECLKQDKNSRVACEVFATNRLIVIGGEITTNAYVDVVQCAWKILKKINYSENDFSVLSCINSQSQDIKNKVNISSNKIGAGDQGVVFGYACDETNEFLPLSIVLSNELVRKATELIKAKKIRNIYYDMKSQVSLDYSEEKVKVDNIIFSIQHDKKVSLSSLRKTIETMVIIPILKKYKLNIDCKKYINYGGNFIIGGPIADTGLTGRKIIADSYGPSIYHGGGAYSGKDYTKVDRSGAYFARYIAKNLVAAGIAKKMLVQLSFCIGNTEPVNIQINTYNTSKYSLDTIYKIIKKSFNFNLYDIIKDLNLYKPIYHKTSVFGHYGKNDLPWEKLDKLQLIKKNIKDETK